MSSSKQNTNLKKLLESVSGVGPKMAEHILEAYASADEIKNHSPEEISARVKGVSARLAKEIKDVVEHEGGTENVVKVEEIRPDESIVAETELEVVDQAPKAEAINVYAIGTDDEPEVKQEEVVIGQVDEEPEEIAPSEGDPDSPKKVTRHVPIRSSGLDFKQEEGEVEIEELEDINEEEISASKKVNPFATFHKAEVHLNYAGNKTEDATPGRREFMDIKTKKVVTSPRNKAPKMVDMNAADLETKVSYHDEPDSGTKKPWLGISFVVFGILFVLAGIWFSAKDSQIFQNDDKQDSTDTSDQVDIPVSLPVSEPLTAAITEEENEVVEEESEEVVEIEEEPEEVEETPVVTSEVNVAVLNGSGVSGAAGNAANLLRAAGFNVSYVGNANNFGYSNTTIYQAEEKGREAEAVRLSLQDSDAIAMESSAYPGQTTDVVVVIGK